jgi:menaquinone-9 beta-reductase
MAPNSPVVRPMPTPSRCTLAIVGGGTAGTATALLAARAGIDTVVIERRGLGQAGARWLNTVPQWCFDHAGISPPRPHAPQGPYHMVAGWGPNTATMPHRDVLELDMRTLVTELREAAQVAGARFVDHTRVGGLDGHTLRTDGGALRFDVVVDAGGLAGPDLVGNGPCKASTLCTAAQWVYELDDEGGARSWYDALGIPFGESVCHSGVAGGYSVLSIRVHEGQVAVLAGVHATAGTKSARQLLASFVEEQRWIGRPQFGGGRAIPIGPPRRLHAGRAVAIGDTAGQVYAAHGSGVGQQLIAAACLVDVIRAGGGPSQYEERWVQQWGAALRRSATFARLSSRLSRADVEALLLAGVLTGPAARAAMEQRPIRPDLHTVRHVASVVRKSPRVCGKLATAWISLAHAND